MVLKSAILLYGPPGAGKTGAACEAVPKGLWLGLPDRFNTGFGWCGIPRDWPILHPARNVKEMIAGLKQNKARAKEFGVILDDMTLALLAELTLIAPGVDKYAWPHYNTLGIHTAELLQQVAEVIAAGAPVVFTCHSKEPMVDEETKKKIQGTPALTGNSATQIGGVADIYACIRADEPYHPYRLHTRTTGDYSARSRYVLFPSQAPMSIAMMLKKVFPQVELAPRFGTHWGTLEKIAEVFGDKDIPLKDFTPYHERAIQVALAAQDAPGEILTRWLLFQGYAMSRFWRKPTAESLAVSIKF